MKKYFHLLILGLSIISCDWTKGEEEPKPASKPELPPITQEGKNTYGFLLNGEIWLPKGDFNIYGDHLYASYINGRFQLVGSRYNPKLDSYQDLVTYIDEPIVFDTGVYILREPGRNLSGAWFDDDFVEYKTDSIVTGTLHLTRFDLDKRIAAGTFDITLVGKANTTDTIRITEGRFDMKF